MHNMKIWIFRTIDLIVILALGVCYVELLRYTMDTVIFEFGDMMKSYSKMLLTGCSSFFASLVILLANKFVTRKNSIYTGIGLSAAAFYYFYVYKASFSVLNHIYLVFTAGYSLFAFVAFLGFPLLLGLALNQFSHSDALPRARC